MTAFKMTVPPSTEPVTLADAKAQARIDTTADDALVSSLIIAARQYAEKYTNRAFITQTWQMWIDLWPAATEPLWDGVRQGTVSSLNKIHTITLPRAPLQSVTKIQYFDDNDAATLWPSSNYFVDTAREPGRLALRSGATWPIPSRLTNGILVEYVVGYGADGSAVPEAIKTAIRQLVAHWFAHRGDVTTISAVRSSTASSIPLVIEALLDPFRLRSSSLL